VTRFEGGVARLRHDVVAGEEPLEIRVAFGDRRTSLVVTMRTPGDDLDLALGYLYDEGIVDGVEDVARVGYCEDLPPEERYNVVVATLRRGPLRPLPASYRAVSACGVCGRRTLAELGGAVRRPVPDDVVVDAEAVLALLEELRGGQRRFARTGGVHGVALFDRGLGLVALREDVGRHNAFDKAVGAALRAGRLAEVRVAAVSGRGGFEILEKAVAAGVPVVVCVSAPSSLAVAAAERYGITLVGFARGQAFNCYSHPERILAPSEPGRAAAVHGAAPLR
jgi:FdhD protein